MEICLNSAIVSEYTHSFIDSKTDLVMSLKIVRLILKSRRFPRNLDWLAWKAWCSEITVKELQLPLLPPAQIEIICNSVSMICFQRGFCSKLQLQLNQIISTLWIQFFKSQNTWPSNFFMQGHKIFFKKRVVSPGMFLCYTWGV